MANISGGVRIHPTMQLKKL